jgi:hypothetical protein
MSLINTDSPGMPLLLTRLAKLTEPPLARLVSSAWAEEENAANATISEATRKKMLTLLLSVFMALLPSNSHTSFLLLGRMPLGPPHTSQRKSALSGTAYLRSR